MTSRIDSQQLLSGVLESPLGRITISAAIRNSGGVPLSKPRIFGSYAAVYMLAGQGCYLDPAGQRCLSPGDLILVFPDVLHAYGPIPGGFWDELFIVFDGPIFDLLRKQGVLNPRRPILHLEPLPYWIEKWKHVVCEPAGQGVPSPLTAIGRLISALTEASDLANAATIPSAQRSWLLQAKALLDTPTESAATTLEDVAQELGMSYVAFRKRFTQLASISPGQYRARRIIDRACQLMQADPRLINKELARLCGFANGYHFSRRFKQIIGLTPKQYRSQLTPHHSSEAAC